MYTCTADHFLQDVKESALVISDQFPGHQLPGGIVQSSAHHTWIASAGKDGQIIVRDVSKLVSR